MGQSGGAGEVHRQAAGRLQQADDREPQAAQATHERVRQGRAAHGRRPAAAPAEVEGRFDGNKTDHGEPRAAGALIMTLQLN